MCPLRASAARTRRWIFSEAGFHICCSHRASRQNLNFGYLLSLTSRSLEQIRPVK